MTHEPQVEIPDERIESLNEEAPREGRYVLYWMQQAQRADGNHALEYAVRLANDRDLPVVTVFGLTADYPEANQRHYAFMLEGLAETAEALQDRGIAFVLREAQPHEACAELAKNAALTVVDAGYLAIQRKWRKEAARALACPLLQVETDVVVPIELVSYEEEYAARTIRPKIHRLLDDFLVPLRKTPLQQRADGMTFKTLDPADTDGLLKRLDLDRSVQPSEHYEGGAKAAEKLLHTFIEKKLADYDDKRNDPSLDYCSHMSPYLHFGQISPLEIALAVLASDAPQDAKDAYIEELIVRRELSMNFVHFNKAYDRYDCAPDWARRSLRDHADDQRDYLYDRDAWERADTHDPYWNAAQLEMVRTGKMHNYMRMYWGKKLIEWSATPEEAFETMLYLNNKYELDGRDANSFTGVAWCFGKHDRPWTERNVFGKIRYMNANGLKRKFNIEAYVKKVDQLGAP
jgi:deoxyribodipyrimidine photo-lyase